MTDALPKMMKSSFRNIYAKSVRRSEWYDTGPGHGLAVAANPKMIALAVEVSAGGLVQVAKMSNMGRGRMEMGKITEHERSVCDVKWNPFNDNVLATASDDTTVRVWHIDDMLKIRCLRVLRAHSRRVSAIEWHTTVDNAIFSISLDGSVVLWNIEIDEVVYIVQECNPLAIALSYDCSDFAVTTKTRELVVYDARTGERQRGTMLVHDGTMPSRVVYCGTSGKQELLVTTGSSRSTRRQAAVYRSNPLDTPLKVVDIDDGSGLLMPIADIDLSLLFIAGKGDANIRFYELHYTAPFISYLGESSCNKAHTAVCALPKRGLNVSNCEIMRIYRVDAEQLVIEPLSFIVPRKGNSFQADLFPATRSPTPSLTFHEWHAGLSQNPVMLELRDIILNCTNKPVTFARQDNKRNKLYIANVNNEKKFRFLSQVTKPDYRKVADREDREDLLKLEEVQAKIAAEIAAKNSIGENEQNNEMMDTNGIKIGNENGSVVEISDEMLAMKSKNTSLTSRYRNNVGLEPSLRKTRQTNGVTLTTIKSGSLFVDEHSMDTLTEDGGGIIMKPTQRHNSPLMRLGDENRKENVREGSEDNTSTRSCFSEEALACVINELEKELYKWRSRCEQLEKVVQLQQQDIDSLRFEINWKNSRIEFLQTQLAQLDSARAASSRSS